MELRIITVTIGNLHNRRYEGTQYILHLKLKSRSFWLYAAQSTGLFHMYYTCTNLYKILSRYAAVSHAFSKLLWQPLHRPWRRDNNNLLRFDLHSPL